MTLGTSFAPDVISAFDSLLDADSFDFGLPGATGGPDLPGGDGFGLPGAPDPDGAQPTPEDMLNEAGGGLVGMVVGGHGAYGSVDNPFSEADKDIWREFGGWYQDGKTLIFHEPGFTPGAPGVYWFSDDGDFGFLVSEEGEDEILETAFDRVDKEMTRAIERDMADIFGAETDTGAGGSAGTTTGDDGLTLTEDEMAEVFARLFGGSDPLLRTAEIDGLDVLVVEDAEAFAALMRAGGPLDPDAMSQGAHPEYDISPEALDAPLINPGPGDDPLG